MTSVGLGFFFPFVAMVFNVLQILIGRESYLKRPKLALIKELEFIKDVEW